MRRESPMLRHSQFLDGKIDDVVRLARLTHVNQLRVPPSSNWPFDSRNQFRKRGQVCNRSRSESLGFTESFVNRANIIVRRKLRFLRIDSADPVRKRFLARNFAAQAAIIEVTVRVD